MKEIKPLEIKVGKIEEGSGMQTFLDGSELSITINQAYLDKDGVFTHSEKKGYVDNGGYVHEGTVADTFAAAFAHESLHARHYYWFSQAEQYYMKHGTSDYSKYKISVDYLRGNGFSEEFISIFYYEYPKGVWNKRLKNDDIDKREHAYFRKHEQNVIRQVSLDYQEYMMEFHPDE